MCGSLLEGDETGGQSLQDGRRTEGPRGQVHISSNQRLSSQWLHRPTDRWKASACLRDYGVLAPFCPIAGDRPEATHDLGEACRLQSPPAAAYHSDSSNTCRHAGRMLLCVEAGRRSRRAGWISKEEVPQTAGSTGTKAQGRIRPAMQLGVPQMWAVSCGASQAKWGWRSHLKCGPL